MFCCLAVMFLGCRIVKDLKTNKKSKYAQWREHVIRNQGAKRQVCDWPFPLLPRFRLFFCTNLSGEGCQDSL